ncbi:hypothetical protein [Gloeobacter kilaueensis]|uniref:Uncharacterized protein n=1 Tax=Gloeobacter kilaueensis (strain ATCC BAA-2537 / CCAP 1431/1 / ULC 316 / JS1) TaxID=1183438 RepID=U5QIK6_GLOK1|nr:hypothetical protein [Gloeobacter kilaueensis]AGY57495.1 hypothetical protein GKIL_1249 [Gloeobacter kilaueensis JS1]
MLIKSYLPVATVAIGTLSAVVFQASSVQPFTTLHHGHLYPAVPVTANRSGVFWRPLPAYAAVGKIGKLVAAADKQSAPPPQLVRTIASGSRTSFQFALTNADRSARLSVRGLPAEARYRFVINSNQATLYVWTTPWTPGGQSTLIIGGSTAAGAIKPVSATLITQSVPVSAAYGIWTPTVWDTCSVDIHNSYSVVGPDGKLYPTWHPPVDPATGCTFGHEHGMDPSGFSAYDLTGGVPFGLANEALDAYAPTTGSTDMRHEDHVGHKISYVENVASSTVRGNTCSILTHVHQGTHSADAFSNNLHEVSYYARCSDGTQFAVDVLASFGVGGQFLKGCDHATPVTTVPPVPADSPSGPIQSQRDIPELSCVQKFILVPNGQTSQFSTNDANHTFGGLYESWAATIKITALNQKSALVFLTPSFPVINPSRYYNPSFTNGLGRSIDICSMVESNGDAVHGTTPCSLVAPGTTYDNPASPFNGAHRVVAQFGQLKVNNPTGPTVWYTDPYGGNGQTTPFTGSIEQFISANANATGQSFGIDDMDVNFSATGVHSPN